MRAYCAGLGLPFDESILTWKAGLRAGARKLLERMDG